MPNWWIWFEAVNYDQTVFDTGDLSTIRGASLALLKIPEALIASLGGIRSIQHSSACLIEVEADSAVDIGRDITRWLADPTALEKDITATIPELCFTWGVVPSSGNERFAEDYISVRNAALENRFRSPTVPRQRWRPKEDIANMARRALGAVAQRHRYFDHLEASPGDVGYPLTFNDICNDPPEGTPVKLKNKMAVIQFDVNKLGHRFSEIRKGGFDRSKAASEAYESSKKIVLNELVKCFIPSGEGKQLPLEVLMWGGDEALFIVPGWLLLDALEVLADSLPGLNLGNGAAPLCVATGAVICDRKTPIRRVKELLGDVVREVKSTSRRESLLQYYLAGMYELPLGSLATERRRLFDLDRAPASRALSLELGRIPALRCWLEAQLSEDDDKAVSRSQLQQLIEALLKRNLLKDSNPASNLPERLLPVWHRVIDDFPSWAPEDETQYPAFAALHAQALRPFVRSTETGSANPELDLETRSP